MKKRTLRSDEEDEEVVIDLDETEEISTLAESGVKATKADPLSITRPETLDKLAQWLDERKTEWKNLRESRRQDRLHARGGSGVGHSRISTHQYGLTTNQILFGTSSSTTSDEFVDSTKKKRVGIEDLVKNAARAVTHGLWQIVEFQETDSPGIFIAWSFTGASQLQKLYVNIPRIIYVNCRPGGGRAELTAKELGGRLVKKDLPHGRGVYGLLYEIHLQEYKYVKNERALGLFLCDPMVEGVYETRTPLSYRAILRLGCIASVTKSTSLSGGEGLSASTAFKLKDLKFVNSSSSSSTSDQKYLERDSASYRKIFLYHIEDSRRGSGVGLLGLFIITENNNASPTDATSSDLESRPFTAKSSVWIVQPRGVVERPPMQRIFRRFCSDERNTCKFTTTSVATMSSAFAACNELLAGYVRERRGPTIVIAQS
jgi:hypothetical protein